MVKCRLCGWSRGTTVRNAGLKFAILTASRQQDRQLPTGPMSHAGEAQAPSRRSIVADRVRFRPWSGAELRKAESSSRPCWCFCSLPGRRLPSQQDPKLVSDAKEADGRDTSFAWCQARGAVPRLREHVAATQLYFGTIVVHVRPAPGLGCRSPWWHTGGAAERRRRSFPRPAPAEPCPMNLACSPASQQPHTGKAASPGTPHPSHATLLPSPLRQPWRQASQRSGPHCWSSERPSSTGTISSATRAGEAGTTSPASATGAAFSAPPALGATSQRVSTCESCALCTPPRSLPVANRRRHLAAPVRPASPIAVRACILSKRHLPVARRLESCMPSARRDTCPCSHPQVDRVRCQRHTSCRRSMRLARSRGVSGL